MATAGPAAAVAEGGGREQLAEGARRPRYADRDQRTLACSWRPPRSFLSESSARRAPTRLVAVQRTHKLAAEAGQLRKPTCGVRRLIDAGGRQVKDDRQGSPVVSKFA